MHSLNHISPTSVQQRFPQFLSISHISVPWRLSPCIVWHSPLTHGTREKASIKVLAADRGQPHRMEVNRGRWTCKHSLLHRRTWLLFYFITHKFPDPWHWIKNCLEQWVEHVFRFYFFFFFLNGQTRNVKQLGATPLNSINQEPAWQRPCINTWHMNNLWTQLGNSFKIE